MSAATFQLKPQTIANKNFQKPLFARRQNSRSMQVKAQNGHVNGQWAGEDQRRFLHAVMRVGKLQETTDYYQKAFGLKVLRERDVPEGKFKNVFMGYGPEDKNFALELTYNYGVEQYDAGEGFGHFGINSADAFKTVDNIKAVGGKILKEAGCLPGGKINVAFAEDPNGYQWEIIQRGPGPEPLCQVMLRVANMEKAIDYYTKALGMQVLRFSDRKDSGGLQLAFLGYGPEDENAAVELHYYYGKDDIYSKGNAYAQLALGSNDVYKTAQAVKDAGYKVTKEPQEVMGGTKIFATEDPDGYKIVFVDNKDFLKELA